MKYTHQAIVCIVNIGYAEEVMSAARKFGARGGTVLNARGTASRDAEKFFGITVEPEKEIVLIVVPTECAEDILHALYKEVGLDTAGQGIAFALPVDSVVGIASGALTETKKTDDTKEKQDK